MDIPYIPLMSIAGEGRGYHRWRRRHLEESLALMLLRCYVAQYSLFVAL